MPEAIEFFPISVEQTNWQAARETLEAIRRKVFIDEQKVPEEEELDGLDADAVHWLAWGEHTTPMGTARLAGNKIGRMAVLEPYRRKGVGSSILRAIIRFALDQKYSTLVLDAQRHAVGFYEDNGFAVTGSEFLDAGIPHLPMAMDLGKFSNRRFEPPPPDISEELRQHVELTTPGEFAEAALRLVQQSDRTIRIFSHRLDPSIYDSDAFCSAIHELAVSHPYARVQILVRDTPWLGKNSHRLVNHWQRLQSRMELRRVTEEVETPHTEFMTGDDTAVLYVVNPSRYQGYLCLHAPVEVRRLNEDFEAIWNHSEPDPQVRRLHI